MVQFHQVSQSARTLKRLYSSSSKREYKFLMLPITPVSFLIWHVCREKSSIVVWSHFSLHIFNSAWWGQYVTVFVTEAAKGPVWKSCRWTFDFSFQLSTLHAPVSTEALLLRQCGFTLKIYVQQVLSVLLYISELSNDLESHKTILSSLFPWCSYLILTENLILSFLDIYCKAVNPASPFYFCISF